MDTFFRNFSYSNAPITEDDLHASLFDYVEAKGSEAWNNMTVHGLIEQERGILKARGPQYTPLLTSYDADVQKSVGVDLIPREDIIEQNKDEFESQGMTFDDKGVLESSYKGRVLPAGSKMATVDQQKKIDEAGLTGVLKPDKSWNENTLDLMIDTKRGEISKQAIYDASPNAYAPVGFIAQVLTSIADPVTLAANYADPMVIASSFMGKTSVGWNQLFLQQAESRAGAFGRRAALGAIGGATGMALIEPFNAMVKTQQQSEYDMATALENIMFGAALGASMHAAMGFVGDAIRGRGNRVWDVISPDQESEQLRIDLADRIHKAAQDAGADISKEQAEASSIVFDTTARSQKWHAKDEGAGDFTLKDYYDAWSGTWVAHQDGVVYSEGETLFQFVGQKALSRIDKLRGNTYFADLLQKAKDMETQGIRAADIHFATGMHRGADGAWRYEVPDPVVVDLPTLFASKAVKNKATNTGEIPFVKLIDPKDSWLFEAYPDLKKWVFEFAYDADSDTLGWCNKKGKRIALNVNTRWAQYDPTKPNFSSDQALETMQHEMQHAIQGDEGFAVGGSYYTNDPRDKTGKTIVGIYGYKLLAGEAEARNTASRNAKDPEGRRIDWPYMTLDVPQQDQIVTYGTKYVMGHRTPSGRWIKGREKFIPGGKGTTVKPGETPFASQNTKANVDPKTGFTSLEYIDEPSDRPLAEDHSAKYPAPQQPATPQTPPTTAAPATTPASPTTIPVAPAQPAPGLPVPPGAPAPAVPTAPGVPAPAAPHGVPATASPAGVPATTAPAAPSTPAHPGKPAAPTALPSGTGTPELPYAPGAPAPAVPTRPGMPAVPGKPGGLPAVPASPEAPVQPVTPEGTPALPGTSGTTALPAPSTAGVPANPGVAPAAPAVLPEAPTGGVPSPVAPATPAPSAPVEILRGATHFLEQGKIVIELFKEANVTTAMHEMSHVMRREMEWMADRGGDWAKQRYQTACDFVGAKPGEKWTVEQEEKFARASEKYWAEGVAPSPEMKATMQSMKQWFQEVYTQADLAGMEISPEMRKLFGETLTVSPEDARILAQRQLGSMLMEMSEGEKTRVEPLHTSLTEANDKIAEVDGLAEGDKNRHEFAMTKIEQDNPELGAEMRKQFDSDMEASAKEMERSKLEADAYAEAALCNHMRML